MSEKRKPEIVLIAELPGKPSRNWFKIELFHVSQWKDSKSGTGWRPDSIAMLHADVYRVRVCGKWYKPSNKTPLTLSEVFALFRKSLTRARAEARNRLESGKPQRLQPSDSPADA